MSDVAEVKEALGYMDWIHDVAADWPDVDENYEVIADAARRWSEFPTDEDVKAAIQAHRIVNDRIAEGESSEGEFDAMLAALEAVRARETGE